MKLKHLEMTLQRLRGFSRPQAALEQYQTPAPLAARLLYHALMKGDIKGKTVCDLGCGTGILAIGAALLGAASVTGVDIDERALAVARENADLLGTDITFLAVDLREGVCRDRIGACDTVVMNPPFGAQKVHADRPFIDCAIAVAGISYSIFNAGSIPFVEAYTAQKAEITEKIGGAFPIKRTFAFHTRDVQEIEVEILRLKRIV
ncbi:MAG: METTL5 family protein [Methanoregula sp.]|jgi:putative methylase|nr:METTL5 family protein [Methanoregula sp.]